MQKSNFEKQVRDQLEELHFRPSAPVWDHIANNIRRRRRRRLLAYFSILALLMTGAGFAYLYRSEPNRQSDPVAQNLPANPVPSADPKGESVPPENNSFSNEQASAADRPTNSAGSSDERRNQHAAKELMAPTYSPDEQPVNRSSDLQANNRSSDAATAQNSESTSASSELLLNPRTDTDDRRTKLVADPATMQSPDSGKVAVNDNVVFDIKNNIVSAEHLSDLSAASLQTHQDSATLAVHENTITGQWKKKSWEWGIEMGAGAGYRRNQSLPGVDAAKAAQADLTTGSPLQTGRLTNSLSVLRYFPSKSNEGFGWSIGLTARKEIASHVRFSAGLRYNYQSDRILIGEMQSVQGAFPSYVGVTGTGSPVYLGPQNQTFTNRYHLIQLPVGLEVQLNKGRKTPISWEAGLAPGYLLATRARVYDKAYFGIYYEDPSQFNRLQVAATTGFSVELRSKQNHRLVLGPDLRFSLTPKAGCN